MSPVPFAAYAQVRIWELAATAACGLRFSLVGAARCLCTVSLYGDKVFTITKERDNYGICS